MSRLLKITAIAAAPVVALTMIAAPASAQSHRDRDNTSRNALIGAAVGGLAGALYGNGDGNYIAGGALAGAALGAVASNRGSGCEYYRGGRCYRNQGHWEREHGINSRDYGYDYRYDGRRYESRYDRRYDRDYRDDRGYRRDYRYDRRW
ncbi:glycine zipper 2TM domain-containing protein [Brevundimonas sp. SORGH_AS_0993]|uniref:glycine zipper 2TM domain-containing protein n=1 Tax=Brevundimonas sp. SORGH_AS_0993 TaxID=3041794 RepID=UPI00277F011A|nr:glycine zipper 2TM domain-containing protein [Brevundimonas sp. SORGH_AS_0993]MDQ1155052.1 uncharacterized protein YcfJ [Brevundimonas sp. SORGH_AS_0993]